MTQLATSLPKLPLVSGDPLRDLNARPHVFVSLLIPCFNESEAIGIFIDRVSELFAKHPELSLQFVFVNDGSTDATLQNMLLCQAQDNRIRIVDLTRNFGKEAALSAGLTAVTGDVIVPIDVDLQHPPEVIIQMIEKWREGYDVVLAKRSDRDQDPALLRLLTNWFYKVQNRVADTSIPTDVGDFRLMDRAVVDILNQLPEARRFMKGLFAWVGFPSTTVEFTPDQRVTGSSKFNGIRLWNFALEGLTSFSTAPLKIWSYIGIAVALFSFLNALYILFRVFVIGIETPGFASVFTAVTFLGGLQLIGIGMIGEYVGRTYIEAKRRPPFLVRRIYGDDDAK